MNNKVDLEIESIKLQLINEINDVLLEVNKESKNPIPNKYIGLITFFFQLGVTKTIETMQSRLTIGDKQWN